MEKIVIKLKEDSATIGRIRELVDIVKESLKNENEIEDVKVEWGSGKYNDRKKRR